MEVSCKAVNVMYLAMLVLVASIYAAPRGTACGSDRYISGGAGNDMDQKVYGCPNGQSWEACCAACGSSLQSTNTLKSVSYQMNQFKLTLSITFWDQIA